MQTDTFTHACTHTHTRMQALTHMSLYICIQYSPQFTANLDDKQGLAAEEDSSVDWKTKHMTDLLFEKKK